MLKLLAPFLLLAAAESDPSPFPPMMPGDTREVRGSDSPKWLEAVGRINTAKGNGRYACSISLVADRYGKNGSIGVTAGHCLSHWINGDGTFTPNEHNVVWASSNGEKVTRRIAEVYALETHKADFAIVRFNKPVPRQSIQPLIVAPWDYRDLLDPENLEPGAFGTMAGYSADTGKGQRGEVLTYDRCERLNGGVSGQIMGFCHAYRGASGGAVVVTVNVPDPSVGGDRGMNAEILMDMNDTIKPGKHHFWVGSILGGRTNKVANRNLFTEATYHREILDPILAGQN